MQSTSLFMTNAIYIYYNLNIFIITKILNRLHYSFCKENKVVVVTIVVVVGDGTRPYQFSWMFVSIQKEENHSPFLFQAYLK